MLVSPDTSKRDVRVNLGSIAERQFIGLLFYNNKKVLKIGQETWMPPWVHTKLRYTYDEDVEMIRHFPDLATEKALIQVKSAPNEAGYPTVTIEAASYCVSKRLQELGIPVLVVWKYQNGKFYGNWVELLMIKEPETPREEANGAHTPYLLVDKSNHRPASEFFGML